MSTTLKRVLPLESSPDFVRAFSNVVAEAHGKVCSICGLERMGHDPESKWLGYEEHSWDGIVATPEQMKNADRLTSEAYRAREAGRA